MRLVVFLPFIFLWISVATWPLMTTTMLKYLNGKRAHHFRSNLAHTFGFAHGLCP